MGYLFLEKKTQGTIKIIAPKKAGLYDVRMNDSDNNGKEVAYTSFEVKE